MEGSTRVKIRNVGDLIDLLAGATEAEWERIARRASALSHGATEALGLAVAVMKMNAALKVADRRETKKASDSLKGGDKKMTKPMTGSSRLAMDNIHAYAKHHRTAGESMQEAIARTCAEQPSLYRQFDDARREEASQGIPPRDVRPTPTKAASLDPLIVERMALEDELRAGAEQRGQDFETYCTGDGKDDYAVLDEMGRRGVGRAAAERIIGKE